MNKRFLLLPVSLVFWDVATYMCMYGVLLVIPYMFSIQWLALLVLSPIIAIVMFSFFSGLIQTLFIKILDFYGDKKWINILHALMGLIAVVNFTVLVFDNPVIAYDSTAEGIHLHALLSNMWEDSWLKTILTLHNIGLPIISLGYASTIATYFKFKGN